MVQLLNYYTTHPDTVIWNKQSDTILAIHTDVSYLSKPKEHSLEGGQLFLTKKPKRGQPMMYNGALHVLSIIINNVMPSEAEAKIAALYLNEKGGVVIQNMLEEIGHSQP